jgi:hypothetical protein
LLKFRRVYTLQPDTVSRQRDRVAIIDPRKAFIGYARNALNPSYKHKKQKADCPSQQIVSPAREAKPAAARRSGRIPTPVAHIETPKPAHMANKFLIIGP